MKKGRGRQNGMKLSLLTSYASVCKTTMVGASLCTATLVLHRVLWYGAVMDNTRIPLVRIAGTLNSQRYVSEVLETVVLPYLQGLATAIFQQDNVRDHTWHPLSKGSSSITRLNCFSGRLALWIFRRKKTCGPWLLND
ncbi:transposable element Tcb1 transposase [Trichonephila clavipes]|nr:transposable element Tcb1 transposase [Trichonephila clavipes]